MAEENKKEMLGEDLKATLLFLTETANGKYAEVEKTSQQYKRAVEITEYYESSCDCFYYGIS